MISNRCPTGRRAIGRKKETSSCRMVELVVVSYALRMYQYETRADQSKDAEAEQETAKTKRQSSFSQARDRMVGRYVACCQDHIVSDCTKYE